MALKLQLHAVCRYDQFLVKLDFERPSRNARIATLGHDLFVKVEDFIAPRWMPPVPIDYNASLHKSLEVFLTSERAGPRDLQQVLQSIIITCWRRRLHLNSSEIWSLLGTQGFNNTSQAKAIELFDFGFRLLVGAQGRPPESRHRMPAMSQGRYTTKSKRDIRLRLFG